MTTAPQAQSAAEQACAFAMSLRSVFTVERVLELYPDDTCVPVMLSAIPTRTLLRLNPELVASLPASTLRLIPAEILAQLGISGGSTRAVPTTPRQYSY